MGETPDRPREGMSRAAARGARIFDRAERWGQAKWLIAMLVVIAVIVIAVVLGRGM